MRRLAAFVSATCVLAALSAGSARVQAVPAGCDWAHQSSPDQPEGDNVLEDVHAISRSDVWAVGEYGHPRKTLTLHDDGSGWSIVASPNKDVHNNEVFGVSASGPDDVWAVGSSGSATLIEHWDGSVWSIVAGPSPYAVTNVMESVDGVSTTDLWAAGWGFGADTETAPILLHWDGALWTSSPAPPQPLDMRKWIYSVAAVASDDVWAAGEREDSRLIYAPHALHWNGRVWKAIRLPRAASVSRGFGAAAASASDVWVVGIYGTGGGATMSLHWDGTSWSFVSTPNSPGDNWVSEADALASGEVWAVGFATGDTLVLHRCGA
jgi:hypothetical protein